MIQINNPYPQFFDADGDPLDNGKVYFGVADLDPRTNPKVVYSDFAGTTPVTQPVRTQNGYLVNGSGTPISVYVDGDHSIAVYTSADVLLWSAPDSTQYNVEQRAIDRSNNIIADLASSASDKGDALITVKRTDIASAASITLHDWHQAERVNVLQVGVKGDGSADDAALLNTLGAIGVPLFIPYTTAGYKIGSTVTFSCDVWCDGFFVPTTSIGSAANDYNRFAVVIASAGYEVKRKIIGLKIKGSVSLRAANVSGIRNDCENSHVFGAHVSQLNFGIVARSYSQTYEKCNANQCNTNFSAYARSSSQEINALTVNGGNYDSPVVRSMHIGDTSWSDAWGGGNYHGSVVSIGGGVNFDGGELKIDWCIAVKLDTGYSETSVSDFGIVLGGGADGSVRNVDVGNWYFKSLKVAIKCLSAVNGLVVRRNFYSIVSQSALYLVSDLYHCEYHSGDSTASFTLGKEVHTGFRFLAPSGISFSNLTIPHLGLYRGVQQTNQDVGDSFPGWVIKYSNTSTKTDSSGSNLRRYMAAQTGIAGNVSVDGVFTCSVPSQCAAFNGGDAVVLSIGGAAYVRFVDYENGAIYLDGSSGTGPATISQINASGRTEALGTAAPTTSTWARGDRVINITPAVGSPKSWVCTLAGTPGTWVSEGNL